MLQLASCSRRTSRRSPPGYRLEFSLLQIGHLQNLSAVIFDIDGTLLDSNDAHAWAWVLGLAELGIERRFEDVRPLIGMGSDKLIPEVTGLDPESERAKQAAERRQRIFRERYLQTLGPCRGARDLVERVRRDGLERAVATSASKSEVEELLVAAKVADLIDLKTSSDDAEESKPAPDIVEAAVKRLGLPTAELLMVGDTPYDIEAARRAGVRIVAVRCGGWPDHRLAGAIAIFDDPADLLEHWNVSDFAA